MPLFIGWAEMQCDLSWDFIFDWVRGLIGVELLSFL